MKRVKVSTREIVIVVIMLAAVLYGVYDIFIASSSKPTDDVAREDVVGMDNLIADASEAIKGSGSYPVYAHLVSTAEANWKSDPFYEVRTLVIKASDLSLVYTGYLEIGKRKIAVINSESYEIGDELEAIVLSIDKKNERISLGLKQLADNPWDKFNVNDQVSGKITKVTKFGAFVEIAPGIEALLHISNVSWDQEDLKAEEEFIEGNEVEAKIINIDSAKKRISLGVKQMQDDPMDKFTVGQELTGRIDDNKDKTIVIDIGENFKAIIPKRLIANEDDVESNYNKEAEISVKVVEIDKNKRRLIVTDIQGNITDEGE